MKKKGFTLIELLAVIVILAIIALIAVPVIMNIISSARKSAFEDTAYGIIKAGGVYYANALLNDGMTTDATFTFNNGEVSPEGLSVQGSLPQSGKLVVARDGKTAIAISNGTYCITKGYDDSKIETLEEFESCELPATSAKTLAGLARKTEFSENAINVCATSGTCAVGTKFALEVAPGNIQNFYVVSDVNNEVTLIMDRNIEDMIVWISEIDYGCGEIGSYCATNEKGPLTALNYLENQTASWTNIEAKDYTLTDSVYGTIERTTARTRMLTQTETTAVGCTRWNDGEDSTCPTWLYGNLGSDIGVYGFWLSSAYAEDTGIAWVMGLGPFDIGGFVDVGIISNDFSYGVRPVIEISK